MPQRRSGAAGLTTQIELAKASIRRAKRVMPAIFPEYLELKSAEQGLREAKKRLANAKCAWKQLGA